MGVMGYCPTNNDPKMLTRAVSWTKLSSLSLSSCNEVPQLHELKQPGEEGSCCVADGMVVGRLTEEMASTVGRRYLAGMQKSG
jgi:hypothetical protein